MSTNINSNNAFDVTMAELPGLMVPAMEAGLVPIILSSPGQGKSTVCNMIAAEANRRLHDIRLPYYSPTDLAGYPFLTEDPARGKVMDFAPMKLIPVDAGEFIFFDEAPLAPRQTLNVALQITLDKRVADKKLPDDTWIALAGNRLEDRCFSERLSAAMVNRTVVFRVRPDLRSWVEWALGRVSPVVIAFVNFNPPSLSTFNPATWDGESNFASPRSWEFLDRILAQLNSGRISLPQFRILASGILGSGTAAEFAAYLEVYQQLPDIERIKKDPDGAPLPDEPSARIAASACVGNHLDKGNAKALMRYAARFEKRFEVFAMRTAVRRDKSLSTCPEMIQWIIANKDVFVA